MIKSTSDKCHILIPGALLLTLYLIFYNLVGNDAAQDKINYASKIVTPFDHHIPRVPIFITFIFLLLFTLLSALSI